MKITITDTSFTVDKPMQATEIADVLLQVTYNSILAAVDSVPTEKQQDVKEGFYDIMNDMFTAFLETLIPDKELRPDLTAEAILQLENEILDKQLAEIEPILVEDAD